MEKTNWRKSSQVKIDLLIIIGFNVGMFLIFSSMDMLELIVDLAEQYEEWEIDEIIPLFFTIALSLIIFSLRRWSEMRRLYNEVHKLSITDPLTGLYNRRHFNETLNLEIERSKRTGTQLSIIILDVDYFKKINDIQGHNIGDRVLCQFSSILTEVTRKIDTVARWGGEEFIILCPHTSLGNAEAIAEKLMSAIHDFEFDRVGKITATIGAVSACPDETSASIINRADVCLYKGKNNGRNCITLDNELCE
ncbi:GGDEF domain-containing protein [Motiliproteus sp. MSK22-1]|uniref:GGDEF domain-containing protein n=1 Tax=Motiliproteus sp. MSK22-1 TaxID=1897630 RepID=UPI000977781F|nr:GGDEF domain-containing protein [Motiliproteus sp. MSK22-1]OMH39380.1 hypothetical protein BGP75_03445 [Motiliproteus sp. MSK22-1]